MAGIREIALGVMNILYSQDSCTREDDNFWIEIVFVSTRSLRGVLKLSLLSILDSKISLSCMCSYNVIALDTRYSQVVEQL